MSHSVRVLAIAGSVLVLAALAIAGAVTAATPSCVSNIAGTYYRPADFLISLGKDGAVVGHYSMTTQEAIGLQETFTGTWQCSGNSVTIRQFHFLESGSERLVERGIANGTFSGSRTLTLTYTFNVFPENASAADLRSGTGTVVNVPTLQATRVSMP